MLPQLVGPASEELRGDYAERTIPQVPSGRRRSAGDPRGRVQARGQSGGLSMNVFETHAKIVGDYASYIRSFINIGDPGICRASATILKRSCRPFR